MKKLSNTQTYIFLFGAFMMVIGAALNMAADFLGLDVLVVDTLHKIGACVFLLGSLCFAPMQILQTYQGANFTIKRLRTLQVIGDIFFVVSGLFLFENAFRVVYPFFTSSMDSQIVYAQYVNNNWVLFLLVAAILEVYTTHRIAYELKKENL